MRAPCRPPTQNTFKVRHGLLEGDLRAHDHRSILITCCRSLHWFIQPPNSTDINLAESNNDSITTTLVNLRQACSMTGNADSF